MPRNFYRDHRRPVMPRWRSCRRRGDLLGAGGLIANRALYHGIAIQSIWQPKLELDFLRFLCGTRTSLLHQSCSATYQLQVCYGNHSQICTGSQLNWLSNLEQSHCQLKVQTISGWQSNFNWVFLPTSHKIMAWILTQSCSPMLGLQLWCGH